MSQIPSLVFVLLGGKFKKNKTSVVLANNTAKSQDFTVPTGKRWYVLGGRIHNADDVARNAEILVYDSANDVMAYFMALASVGAGGVKMFPDQVATANVFGFKQPYIMEAGDYVRMNWAAGGASAGGTSKVFLHVLEVDV